jgi:hypothetical protein
MEMAAMHKKYDKVVKKAAAELDEIDRLYLYLVLLQTTNWHLHRLPSDR